MLYSPFVLLNDYNNNLAWTWKRNLNDLSKYNKPKGVESVTNKKIDPGLSTTKAIPTFNKIKRKRGLSINMGNVSSTNNCDNNDDDCTSDTTTLCPELRFNGLTKKRSLRDLKNVTTHPLSNEQQTYEIYDPTLPQVDLLNLNDLDLKDDYFSMKCNDIKLEKSYKPLYSRINVNYNKDDSIRKKQISKQLNDKEYELESWPNNEKTNIKDDDNILNDNLTLIPNKRTRQRISNPNFLKLYAIENNSIQRNNLPQIAIDDQSLQNVTSFNLSQFNFDPKIKLAIMTKKKIWIDLCNGIERNDLYGDNCPWNLKFVPAETHPTINILNDKDDSTLSTSSLVRLNSNLRPWKFNSSSLNHTNEIQSSFDQTLLTPCGKLSRGRDYSDLQYVIKGWCDERFQ